MKNSKITRLSKKLSMCESKMVRRAIIKQIMDEKKKLGVSSNGDNKKSLKQFYESRKKGGNNKGNKKSLKQFYESRKRKNDDRYAKLTRMLNENRKKAVNKK